MRYKAVLFDMDGVIVDTEQLHLAAFHIVLKNYGYFLTPEQYKQHFMGKTDEAGLTLYFDFIGETVDLPIILKEKSKSYLQLATDQLIAYPGVLAFIRNLAKRKIPLALVTGSLQIEAEITLKVFDLNEVFLAKITAEDITHSKPNPEGYLLGAHALGVDPAMCIVVEDAPSGIRAANAAGMFGLAVTNTHDRKALKEASLIVDQLLSGCIDSLLES